MRFFKEIEKNVSFFSSVAFKEAYPNMPDVICLIVARYTAD